MRLKPGARVLVRGDGSLQVGVRDPLILDDLTADERRFVERLGTVATVSPGDRSRFAVILARLIASGLVDQDLTRAKEPTPRAAINDGGPIGCGIALALARAGWAVAIDDIGRAVQSPRGTYDPGSLAGTRQAAAADTIRRVLPEADVCAGRARVDVEVIVSHGAPLLAAAVPLMARDTPHVYVTTDERGAQVGPMVIPGRGACGTCVGLGRALADAAWPRLSLQLTAGRTLPHSTPDVTAQAAGLVAGALGWWWSARNGPADAAHGWLDTVWTIDHHAPPSTAAAPASPECGCGAAGPVGDELAARRARMPETS
ncbi:hypothetical protein [Demequina sp.]|uniref:hypothetical protein n=1 Tax=Demequina sp. TaxID=2050685 RepID=UPI0025B8A92E|nr:hypothetical protein [Demequina sp.]